MQHQHQKCQREQNLGHDEECTQLQLLSLMLQCCVSVDWDGVEGAQENCERKQCEQPRDENKQHYS